MKNISFRYILKKNYLAFDTTKVTDRIFITHYKSILSTLMTLSKLYYAVLFQRYWYSVAITGVAFILLTASFVKICAVYTPSSNPTFVEERQLMKNLKFQYRQLQVRMFSR